MKIPQYPIRYTELPAGATNEKRENTQTAMKYGLRLQ
jgi:hypothetical protein